MRHIFSPNYFILIILLQILAITTNPVNRNNSTNTNINRFNINVGQTQTFELKGDILVHEPGPIKSYQSVSGLSPNFTLIDDILVPELNGEAAGTIFPDRRWPGATIPYVISTAFESNEQNIILNAMEEISGSTCFKFKQYNGEKNFIYILQPQDGLRCTSFIGRVTSVPMQIIELGEDCLDYRRVLHELMHAIGFYHEHNRKDRDKFIIINWENIKGSKESYSIQEYVDTFGVDYDYQSIMHYPASPEPYGKIIITSQPPIQEFGTSQHLSEKDKLKINRMYNCKEQTRLTNQWLTATTTATNEISDVFTTKEPIFPQYTPESTTIIPSFPYYPTSQEKIPPKPPSFFCNSGNIHGPQINVIRNGCCFTNTTYHYDCIKFGQKVSYWDEWRSVTTSFFQTRQIVNQHNFIYNTPVNETQSIINN